MINYIILKLKKILKMNLIFLMELNQEKELLEQLKDVKVNLIIKIMQLNMLNKKKELLILVNYKLDKQ